MVWCLVGWCLVVSVFGCVWGGGGCVVWCLVVCVFAVVWGERQREAHTTDVFVTVEFGRMHD